MPLVCCNPHASATGPMAAPNSAIHASRVKSVRRSAASRSTGWRNKAPMIAAPQYNNAAVVKGPRPVPAR